MKLIFLLIGLILIIGSCLFSFSEPNSFGRIISKIMLYFCALYVVVLVLIKITKWDRFFSEKANQNY